MIQRQLGDITFTSRNNNPKKYGITKIYRRSKSRSLETGNHVNLQVSLPVPIPKQRSREQGEFTGFPASSNP